MGPSAHPRWGDWGSSGERIPDQGTETGQRDFQLMAQAGSEPRLEGKTEKEEGRPPCGQNPVPLSRKGQVQEAREGEYRKRDQLETWNCRLWPEDRKSG